MVPKTAESSVVPIGFFNTLLKKEPEEGRNPGGNDRFRSRLEREQSQEEEQQHNEFRVLQQEEPIPPSASRFVFNLCTSRFGVGRAGFCNDFIY